MCQLANELMSQLTIYYIIELSHWHINSSAHYHGFANLRNNFELPVFYVSHEEIIIIP